MLMKDKQHKNLFFLFIKMVNDKLMYVGILAIVLIGGLVFFITPDTGSPTAGALYNHYNMCLQENKNLNNNDIFCRCKFAKIHDLKDCMEFTKGDWERNDFDFCMKANFEWIDQGNFPDCWQLLKKR